MRIRTIKPEFFTHEDLFDAEDETGLPLRVAFPGLWCAADREGRFKWKPRTLKAQILPFDDVDFSRVLDALITRGFIVKYASEDGEFGWIPSFSNHQVINNRERDSILPDPSNCKGSDACLTREARVDDACKEEGKGKEGKGKEGKGKEGKGTGVSEPKIPDLNQVIDYLIPKMAEIHSGWTPVKVRKAAKIRLETFIENGWRDGNGNPIKQWKSKFVNCLKHESHWNYEDQSYQKPQAQRIL